MKSQSWGTIQIISGNFHTDRLSSLSSSSSSSTIQIISGNFHTEGFFEGFSSRFFVSSLEGQLSLHLSCVSKKVKYIIYNHNVKYLNSKYSETWSTFPNAAIVPKLLNVLQLHKLWYIHSFIIHVFTNS